jgi:hypothetical protein
MNGMLNACRASPERFFIVRGIGQDARSSAPSSYTAVRGGSRTAVHATRWERPMKKSVFAVAGCFVALTATPAALAAAFTFSTGSPDGLLATASRPASAGKIEIESADDFTTTEPATMLTRATFTGLITGGAGLASIGDVAAEFYRIFPKDSNTSRTPQVPSRANSPSDVAFVERESAAGNLSFTTTLLDGSFTALNSIVNGINKSPNQLTGGEGPVTGLEVLFDVTFTDPVVLPADHFFFIPQVDVTGGEFLWLSAPKTIPAPADLQSWIRNENIDPDWLRIGTDVIGPPRNFNAAFSLSGQIPEPGSLLLLLPGLFLLRRFAQPARR